MATLTQNPPPHPGGNRGRSGNKNRRGGRGGKSSQAARSPKHTTPEESNPSSGKSNTEGAPMAAEQTVAADDVPEDADFCFICAEPVKYYSVSECNHRTCHVCALRLRALYKKQECTFCKTPQPTVIFTKSPDALFSSYAPESIQFKDTKLSIFFETEEMMEDTLILLRFNCPGSDCDYIATGWGDLKLHVRGTHGKVMCDLCIRSKKIFAHEHALYLPSQLPLHLPSMPHRSYKSQPKEQPEGGVHPLCEFCRECFFSDDELYSHMRERHEECFICKRNGVQNLYFQNYDSLERHFNAAHNPCTHPTCLAQKFVVFNTVLDLKAHMVDEHSTELSTRDKKDARRVQADFEFEDAGRRGGRPRDRDPPPQQQRQGGGGGRRREAFGGNLTADASGPGNAHGTTSQGQASGQPSSTRPDTPPFEMDAVQTERYAVFLTRLRHLTPNSSNAINAVKTVIRAYRASEETARGLISTIWNIVDRNLDDTASLITALVDLLDDDEKKQDLLGSWNGFKLEQRRQFPDLIPAGPSGPGYAGIASGRVLNAKHTAASRSSHQTSRQVWDRVAQAAAASSSSSSSSSIPSPSVQFPALTSQSSAGPSNRQGPGIRNTPWASSSRPPQSAAPTSSVSPPAVSIRSENRPLPSSKKPPALNKAAFPELPSSGPVRQKPQVSGNASLKNILGDTGPPASSAWSSALSGESSKGGGGGGGGGGGASADANGDASEDVAAAGSSAAVGGGGKKGKGKGKAKQTLFTLGTFPA